MQGHARPCTPCSPCNDTPCHTAVARQRNNKKHGSVIDIACLLPRRRPDFVGCNPLAANTHASGRYPDLQVLMHRLPISYRRIDAAVGAAPIRNSDCLPSQEPRSCHAAHDAPALAHRCGGSPGLAGRCMSRCCNACMPAHPVPVYPWLPAIPAAHRHLKQDNTPRGA